MIEHRSAWIIALPALIVGPFTYLATVGLLAWRSRRAKGSI
jgi:hypothetical protein